MNTKLNFMCVGVQKAGTSSIHDILSQNPNISLPIYKETHFFCEDEKFNKGLDYYFNFFFKKTDSKYKGEIDPEYSYFTGSAEKIYDAFGKIKIVFVLRNPVERAYSHYLMTKRRGLENLTFLDALNAEKDRLTSYFGQTHYSYINRGYYIKQLESFENVFGKENIRVLFFEDLISNPEKLIRNLSEFVGIGNFNYNFDIKSNPASVSKSKILSKFIYKPYKFKKLVGKLIPSKQIKNKIMFFIERKNIKTAQKEKLSIQTKNKIYNLYFKTEVELLEKKLDLSLNHWKEQLINSEL
ncbi:MAG: hypothetical protein Wins2KO_04500 [Winogradskyella sp.]